MRAPMGTTPGSGAGCITPARLRSATPSAKRSPTTSTRTRCSSSETSNNDTTSCPLRGGGMKQLKFINVRKALTLTVLGAVATVVAGVALATPGSGFKERTVVARGTFGPHFKIKLQDSSSPGDVVVQKFVLAPGGQSGWHLHPGPAVVTVKSGEFTLDQEDCTSATYSAGEVAVERTGDVHRVRNAGTTDLEFWVTFLDIPVGLPQRLEPETDPSWVEPAC